MGSSMLKAQLPIQKLLESKISEEKKEKNTTKKFVMV